jgi:hypothetical protein
MKKLLGKTTNTALGKYPSPCDGEGIERFCKSLLKIVTADGSAVEVVCSGPSTRPLQLALAGLVSLLYLVYFQKLHRDIRDFQYDPEYDCVFQGADQG